MKLVVVGALLLVCSVAAQQTCMSCPAGNFIDTSTGACIPCPMGQNNSMADQTGTGGTSTSCVMCPSGMGTNMDQSQCIWCPAGTLANSGTCWPCPSGTYQPLVGQNDTYGNQSACLPCPLGSKPKPDKSGCDLCPAGTYGDDGADCYPCAATYYSKGVGQTYYHCARCGLGNEPNALGGATDCNLCSPGKYSTNGRVCTSCSGGTFSTKWGSTTSSDCENCPAGRAPNTKYVNGVKVVVGSRCDVCPPGTYSVNGGTCTPCGSGYNPDHGAQNVGACRSCPLGYAPNFDRTGCMACAAGEYSDDGYGCYSCPTNTSQLKTAAKAQTDCIVCPAGKIEAYNRAYTCVCNAGQYEKTDPVTPCRMCPVGRTSIRRTYDTMTKKWVGGTVIDASPDGCTPCDPGTYGYMDNSTGTPYGLCAPCPDGTYNPNNGSVVSSACLNCPDGKYTSYPMLSACMDCIAGKYGVPSHDQCINCAAGTANPNALQSSSTACNNCMAGYYSLPGAATCRMCPPGTFSNAPYDTCAPCDIDSYNNVSGGLAVSACLTCPSGRGLTRESSGTGHWVPSPWRNCSSSCMTTRDVVCANALLQQIPDNQCLASTKPATSMVCDGDPLNQYYGTNANRCTRSCSTNTDNPAKTYVCLDGTCVADANDCAYGNRFILRKRINDPVSQLYKISPQSVLSWISNYEALFNQALSNAAQVKFLLLTPVQWKGAEATEVTFRIQQTPAPDNMFYSPSNNRKATNEYLCQTKMTAAACFWDCANNATGCFGVSWQAGVANGCCLASSTGTSITGGWTFYQRLATGRVNTVGMLNNYYNYVATGNSYLYTTVTNLDPAWGFDWAPTTPPFSTNSASSVSMSMIGLLQILSLGFLLKVLNAM